LRTHGVATIANLVGALRTVDAIDLAASG
jgi:hypothetical protein